MWFPGSNWICGGLVILTGSISWNSFIGLNHVPDVQIVVQSGSLDARNYQSWRNSCTDLRTFSYFWTNYGYLWTDFCQFWSFFGQNVLEDLLRMPERQELFAGLHVTTILKTDGSPKLIRNWVPLYVLLVSGENSSTCQTKLKLSCICCCSLGHD